MPLAPRSRFKYEILKKAENTASQGGTRNMSVRYFEREREEGGGPMTYIS
jgi:hypothetical protein